MKAFFKTKIKKYLIFTNFMFLQNSTKHAKKSGKEPLLETNSKLFL
jgi:hypothetical protein